MFSSIRTPDECDVMIRKNYHGKCLLTDVSKFCYLFFSGYLVFVFIICATNQGQRNTATNKIMGSSLLSTGAKSACDTLT